MENASEALMMAFGVLIFVLALTVAINAFSQAKAVSDVVIFTADETNYYDYQGAIGKASQNRIVGLETIIPTLYKYYKENYTVLFRQGSYDQETGDFSNLRPLIVYNTPSTYKTRNTMLWGKNYDSLMNVKYSPFFAEEYTKEGSKEIFSFDLDEETLRHEPWTGSYEKAKENIDCFLQGDTYKNPNNNSKYINYSEFPLQTDGFIGKYKNTKFVETVGEYTYSSSQQVDAKDTEDGSTISSLVKQKKKRIIIFTKVD